MRSSGLFTFVLCAAAVCAARAQDSSRMYIERGPRFLIASARGADPVRVDIAKSPLLHQRITITLESVTLKEALDRVAQSTGLELAYSTALIPLGKVVRLKADEMTAAAALTELLLDENVDILFSADGKAALIRKSAESSEAVALSRRGAAALPVLGTISGRVIDATSGQGVGRTQLLVLGTALGGVTDDNGQYTIAGVVPGRREVTVRRVGYAPTTKTVDVADGASASLDFSLARVVTTLEQVVTTVTGEQRRKEVGNALAVLSADSIVKTGSITQLSDILMSRVSGVQVLSGSGLAGASPIVRVRGINSIALSNDPLLIIDGVRMANTTASSTGVQAGYGISGGRFNDINPAEIESMDIVKGPSAATLYGTDAANGVIVIKTKRGISGAPQWTAYGETGTIEPAIRFLDNYYSWGHSPSGAVRQCTLVLAAAGTCTIDSLTKFNQMEDAFTSPIGTGRRRQYGLQVAGGTNVLNYFLSGASDYDLGWLHMPASEQARIRTERGGAAIPGDQINPNWSSNLRLRGNFNAALGTNAAVSLSSGLVLNQTSIPLGVNVFLGSAFGEGFNDPTTNGGWFAGYAPGETFAVSNVENVSHFTNALTTNWQPLTWLTTRATVGIDFADDLLDALQLTNEGPAPRNGHRQNTRSGLKLYSVDLGSAANFVLNEAWTSKSSIGVQYNRKKDQYTSATGNGLPPGSQTITGAAVITGAEQNLESVVAGAYVEQTFGWHDRLFFTGAVRGDGGSSFGKDFKTATYPKVNASWIAIEARDGWLNSLRVRGAYGASGVQPSSTAALTIVQLLTVVAEAKSTSGALASTIGNPSLKPERTTEVETGVDGELFKGRVSSELTYYDRLSRDALIKYPQPSEVAVPFQWRNIGAVENRGIEGLINVRAIETRGVALSVALNGSYNWNRVRTLGFVQPVIQSNALNIEGYPLFSRWQRPVISYADANGNGIIEAKEVVVGAVPEFRGPSIPPKSASVAPTLSLLSGRLRVSSLIDHRAGQIVPNSTELNRCGSFIANCQAANDKSAPFDLQARYIAFNQSGTQWGFDENGAFTRWRELAIAYDLPSRVANRFKAKNATVTFAGRNLALWTKYSGGDPEVNGNPGSTTGAGEGYYDSLMAPQSRYWLLRFNLGF